MGNHTYIRTNFHCGSSCKVRVEAITRSVCTHSSPILSLKLWNESLLISSMTFIMVSARSTRSLRCWCRVSFPSNCSRKVDTHAATRTLTCAREERQIYSAKSFQRNISINHLQDVSTRRSLSSAAEYKGPRVPLDQTVLHHLELLLPMLLWNDFAVHLECSYEPLPDYNWTRMPTLAQLGMHAGPRSRHIYCSFEHEKEGVYLWQATLHNCAVFPC